MLGRIKSSAALTVAAYVGASRTCENHERPTVKN